MQNRNQEIQDTLDEIFNCFNLFYKIENFVNVLQSKVFAIILANAN